MTPTKRALAALGAALALGLAIGSRPSPIGSVLTSILEPIGSIWVNALRMTVIPLVMAAIVVGIDALPSPGSVGRIGGRTLLTFLVVLVAASTFATVAGSFVWSPLAVGSVATGGAAVQAPAAPDMGQWLASLVPTNVFKAAADGAMLQLIVFSLAFGLAIAMIDEPRRRQCVDVADGVCRAMLVLVGWVLRATPIGVFALTVPLAAKLGLAAAGAVAYYVAVVSLLTLAFGALFYPAAWLIARCPLGIFARACVPAQTVALGSRSSLASLPALLEGAEDTLRAPAAVRSFVLPLAVSTFRPAGAIAIPMGVLFVAHLHGVQLGPAQLAFVILTSVATTFSVPGIPGGSVLIMAPVLVSVGLPADAVGLLIGVDTIPDIVRTVTNVTGDMAAAALLARFEEEADAESVDTTPTSLIAPDTAL